MEFKVLEETKIRLVFQLIGETHTFCNILKEELLHVAGVEVATYTIAHPLIGVPEFYLETKGLEPRKALKDALKNLKKKAGDFQQEVAKL